MCNYANAQEIDIEPIYDFSAVCESGQTLYYYVISDTEPYTVCVSSFPKNSYGMRIFETNPNGNLAIPESVSYNGHEYSVTCIGNEAFYKCSELTSITIPNSVTGIGDDAFNGCSGLKSVTIPNSVTSIGKYAFYGCSGLTTVNYNATNCTIMGSGWEFVFTMCSSLTALNIGENVENIPSCAFYGCSELTSVTIPNSITSIGEYAFYGCSGLKKVSFPNSVKSIGNNAFNGCCGLTSITIPTSVEEIGNDAFKNCSGMTTINFNAKNCAVINNFYDYYINDDNNYHYTPFRNCTSLTTLKIGENVTNVPEYMFYDCNNLTDITFKCDIDLSKAKIKFTKNGFKYSILNKNSVRILPNSYSGDTIIIPQTTTISGYTFTITSIGDTAFYECNELSYITIPNSVTEIGHEAFAECYKLTSITIPNSVESIGFDAFYGTGWYNNQPDGILYLDGWCIGYKGKIPHGKLEIADGTKHIAGGAFSSSKINSVAIPNSVKNIGYAAFFDCQRLKSIIIPNSVTIIDEYAFKNCHNLKSVMISSSVDKIGYAAFLYCGNLESIIIDKNNKVYDSRNNCNAIIETKTNTMLKGCKNTIIPNSITSIAQEAFSCCNGLKSITVPYSVTNIGTNAFEWCRELESVSISNPDANIEWSAFSECNNIKEMTLPFVDDFFGRIFGAPLYYDRNDGFLLANFQIKYIPSNLSSITINGGYLPYGAFHDCSMLKSITIGEYVKKIDAGAFFRCSGLESITVNPNNKAYDSRDNCNAIIETETNTLVAGCKNTIIPNSVKEIAYYAFWGCYGLESLTIPNSVTSIGDSAFYVCIKLKTIHLPDSLKSIGDRVFENCTNLKSITIPNSVTNIGNMTFSNCKNLKSIAIPNSVTRFGNNAFYGCNGLKSVYYSGDVSDWCNIIFADAYLPTYFYQKHPSWQSMENNSNPLCYAHNLYINNKLVTNLVIPETVTEIKEKSFCGATCIKSVTIPNSVTKIGAKAFKHCEKLESIIIGDSIKNIDFGAFSHCKKLESIVIPNSVTEIGHETFYGCKSLKEMTIPFVGCKIHETELSHFGEIFGHGHYKGGYSASFNSNTHYNYNYNTYYIPRCLKSVTITGNNTLGSFSDCKTLTSITIGDSVKNIGIATFCKCSGLKSITIPNSVTEIGRGAFGFCNGLESIKIGASVSEIGILAFYCCDKLKSIIIDKENKVFDSRENCNAIIETGTNTLVTGCKNTTIPNSVTSIGVDAFYNCDNLKSIKIPDSIKEIGDRAFYNCKLSPDTRLKISEINKEAFHE